MGELVKIGDLKFEVEVIKSNRLTVVDFGATWCGPCKKLHPIMAELANEYKDKINVFEVDVGEASETAMKYGVISVPQLLFFKEGMVKETVVGLLPKSKIEEKIEKHLS